MPATDTSSLTHSQLGHPSASPTTIPEWPAHLYLLYPSSSSMTVLLKANTPKPHAKRQKHDFLVDGIFCCLEIMRWCKIFQDIYFHGLFYCMWSVFCGLVINVSWCTETTQGSAHIRIFVKIWKMVKILMKQITKISLYIHTMLTNYYSQIHQVLNTKYG